VVDFFVSKEWLKPNDVLLAKEWLWLAEEMHKTSVSDSK
jgi:hypothetical protein